MRFDNRSHRASLLSQGNLFGGRHFFVLRANAKEDGYAGLVRRINEELRPFTKRRTEMGCTRYRESRTDIGRMAIASIRPTSSPKRDVRV